MKTLLAPLIVFLVMAFTAVCYLAGLTVGHGVTMLGGPSYAPDAFGILALFCLLALAREGTL